jgi:NADH:ubiquinone oxidoreductase subunit
MEPDLPVRADEKTLILALGVSPMEARFIQAMLNTNDWVGQDELPEVKYSTRQVIYRLRMKLEARRIWIINDGNGRYSIPPACKSIIKREIEKAFAG